MDLTTPALSALLGWAAGMRSMTPLAVLARTLAGQRPPIPQLARRRRQPARTLGSDRAATLLTLAAAGEMVFDKLSVVPPRTSPPALGGRIASGALVGAALAAARRSNPVLPALVGAASAAASSFVMMDLRREAGEALDLPDPMVAFAEDALAIGLSVAAVQSGIDE